ncbi:MAG: helix-turn-helix transcriptional regulator [Actinobacteria bacterium]|nr:helix-turn-helix transcriptional regulator [Actinomycetota bacterium]
MDEQQKAREHPTRTAILLLLLDRTDMTPAELRKAFPDKPSSETIAYHAAVLEQAGLLARVDGLYRRVRPL